MNILRIGDRAKATHLYDVEVEGKPNPYTIQVDARTSRQASSVARKAGFVVRSVNMIGQKKMKVLVTDQLFFKAGDECIFIVNQPYNDEYFMTPGKEYAGVIEEVRIGQSTEVSMKNDKGESVTHEQWFDCFSSGSVTVKALVEKQEFIARVYFYRSKKIKEIVNSIKEEIESLDRYIDSKLELAN